MPKTYPKPSGRIPIERKKIRVIHYGLGPISMATAKLVLTKSDMEILGAVDIVKEMVGQDFGRKC